MIYIDNFQELHEENYTNDHTFDDDEGFAPITMIEDAVRNESLNIKESFLGKQAITGRRVAECSIESCDAKLYSSPFTGFFGRET